MKLRSKLMMELQSHISRTGMSKADAAQLFGVTQPRVSDLMHGKIYLFDLEHGRRDPFLGAVQR